MLTVLVFIAGVLLGSLMGVFCLALLMAGKTMEEAEDDGKD